MSELGDIDAFGESADDFARNFEFTSENMRLLALKARRTSQLRVTISTIGISMFCKFAEACDSLNVALSAFAVACDELNRFVSDTEEDLDASEEPM